jgi:hypothetical protein
MESPRAISKEELELMRSSIIHSGYFKCDIWTDPTARVKANSEEAMNILLDKFRRVSLPVPSNSQLDFCKMISYARAGNPQTHKEFPRDKLVNCVDVLGNTGTFTLYSHLCLSLSRIIEQVVHASHCGKEILPNSI